MQNNKMDKGNSAKISKRRKLLSLNGVVISLAEWRDIRNGNGN